MSLDLGKVAAELIAQLGAQGVRADRFTTGPETAGINVWGEEGRYPLTSVTISDSGKFHDYAWGPRYEHTLPLETTISEVAAAVIATLPGAPDQNETG
ncbi:MAG: hypothetical protein L0H79_17185 [Intrasporangium sp.]|uniref:hypothetical protein n=1 Tax=Intrasporangium sp. TaxID=1925024 RepID=UPI002648233A|nr:hypothetical protein [Intrasporangium sp.]MDN5797466.1 hypothetical protein [Intrasporangium sp.]